MSEKDIEKSIKSNSFNLIEFSPREWKFDEKQKNIISSILDERTNMVFLRGPAGTSKAQPLWSKISTVRGWVEMGDLSVGDLVMTETGEAKPILDIHPQGKKEVYEVVLSDGSKTHCCMDHLWFTQTCSDRNSYSPKGGSVKSLAQIISSMDVGAVHRIPITSEVDYPQVNHEVDPYSFGKSVGGEIPNEYLIDSKENRLNLLRGIMDSEGLVERGVFCSLADKGMSKSLIELVQSLGGTAKTEKKGKNYISNIEIITNPFRCESKSKAWERLASFPPTREIQSIAFHSYGECQCISIDSPNHLYLTDDYIVTHNTYVSVYAALRLMKLDKDLDLLYVRTAIESGSRSMGALPGDAGEKFAPYLQPLADKVEELLAKGSAKSLLESEEGDPRIKAMPVNYLRGANWKDKIVILDECQNFDKKELMTAISRVGENTKVIVCGDPEQSDIGNRSAFLPFFNIFGDKESEENGIHTFEFAENDIKRSEILKFIVKKVREIDQKNK